jgi:hypothetical protein
MIEGLCFSQAEEASNNRRKISGTLRVAQTGKKAGEVAVVLCVGFVLQNVAGM